MYSIKLKKKKTFLGKFLKFFNCYIYGFIPTFHILSWLLPKHMKLLLFYNHSSYSTKHAKSCVCIYIICIILMNRGNCNGEISFVIILYIIFNLHCQWFLCLILDFSLILFFDIFSCSQIKYFFIVFSCFQLTYFFICIQNFRFNGYFGGQRLE